MTVSVLTPNLSDSSEHNMICGSWGATSCPSQFVELTTGVGSAVDEIGVEYSVAEEVVTGIETGHSVCNFEYCSNR
jgi:hypothetical protein